MLKDRYDLDLCTASQTARDAYVDGADRILCALAHVEQTLAVAIEADPDFALAHVALARQHYLCARTKDARNSIETAAGLAGGLTEREQTHVEIFRLMMTGDPPAALELTREHMRSYPLDAFALAPSCGVFGLIGFSGRVEREAEQLALLEPLAGHYGDDWWFLSAHAFALLEMGQWEQALEMMQRSMAQSPRNAHGAHTLTHALYEGGQDERAANYLEDWLPDYDADGLLHCHAWWHLCLLKVMQGRLDEVWPIYDANCAPSVSTSPAINVLTDGCSLLWRAELAGAPVQTGRWEMMRDYYTHTFPKPMVFVDAHGALPFAALGDSQGVDIVIAQVEELGNRGRLPAGTLGCDLSKGFAAFAASDWSTAINTLEPIMEQVVRVGGSRAQRDLVTNTLLAAYVKDGRMEDARALAAAAHDRQPTRPVAGLN